MKSYIKDIVIFNKNGEKRVVPLEQGVNIITGESKTGKSALVEIIDYCLCSTRCTIPKGKITEFAYLYSLVMAIGDNTYVIARYNWNDGGKMHFIKEKEDFELEKLELSYFMEKSQLLCKDVKDEIEYALGLLITNMAKDAEQQGKKASLRNMVSYLFQHQNLMASKFALFYRFSDFYKRKDVIDQFPVFAGMISQEYYSDLIQLNTLKDQLKQKYKKYHTVGARVISKGSGNWFDIFLINRGSKDGIKKDMNVIAGNGLVGIVYDVSSHTAKVRTIINDTSMVSAMFLKTNDACIVNGSLDTMEDGYLEVVYISKDAKVKNGDELVTSYVSSKFNEGITIGKVSDLKLDSTKLTKTAKVTPVVDFKHLKEVLVITDLKKTKNLDEETKE